MRYCDERNNICMHRSIIVTKLKIELKKTSSLPHIAMYHIYTFRHNKYSDSTRLELMTDLYGMQA